VHRLKALLRTFFDVRPGEHIRTLFMALYLLFVLFAYYILKPVARSLFLNKFDMDDVPYLHILIAGAGGVLAYLYSRVAVKTSLRTAVTGAMALSVICLIVIWRLLGIRDADGHARLWWMLYVLNVWTSLFSIVLVSQGWLVAANVFNGREAKRLYGLLGMGAVIGAAFGGEFTRRTAEIVGSTNLLLASAVLVIIAYGCFRVVLRQPGAELERARAAGDQDDDFSFGHIVGAIRSARHLQVIMAIISITFIVDVLVEFQFLAMAKQRYSGNSLTAFFGSFYGIYLNLATMVCQFLLPSAVIARFGVGGTLQIMPVAITIASLFTYFSPGVFSTSAVRLTEAVNRYTLNRTGMELLYLPLPADLRNRTKAFVDIFADRFSRGIGGMLLILLTVVLDLSVRQLALVVMALAAVWVTLSLVASREYVATVRKRLASRRLDIEAARVRVSDPQTVRMLEETASGDNPRQAVYALTLLAETQGYRLQPLLEKLASSPISEVRTRVFELALAERSPVLVEAAQRELTEYGEQESYPTLRAAAAYVVAFAPQALALIDHANQNIAEGALESLCSRSVPVSAEWLTGAVESPDWRRRVRAATALGSPAQGDSERLLPLFEDPDRRVVAAAIRAAGSRRERVYLHSLVRRLGDTHLRGLAIDALASYGHTITGTLADILEDTTLPAQMRLQIPRVLKHIPHQRSVDVLLHALRRPDLAVRGAVIRALNKLRETAPQLNYEDRFVTEQIVQEARFYVELHAALEPFRRDYAGRRATNLLRRTLEERMKQTLERVFRLLGLRYPPKEIYSVYLAVSRRESEQAAAALELLENVLERELKRILLPLLDAPENILERGREIFNVQPKNVQTALRELIACQDPWLAACAMASAAELRLRPLAPDIAEAGKRAQPDVYQVSVSATEALAGA
jgi:ATP/ADP translocase/HEAT repeat protein